MTDLGLGQQTGSHQFWRVLHRINAILIFGLAIFALVMTGWSWWEYRDYSSDIDGDEGGYEDSGSYSGREIKTPDGDIVAYEANADLNFRPERGANVSLTNMSTGRSILIAPDGSSVVAWHILELSEEQSSERTATGYVAFVSNETQFDTGRFDLVVGNFADMTPVTVAENVLFGDMPTVHGDGSVAIIVWAEDESAEFVAIDLDPVEVIERRRIDLPPIETNRISMRNAERIQSHRRGLRSTDSAVAPITMYY